MRKSPWIAFLFEVKLWNIPLELFTNEGLRRITSAIGEPLYMDKATELRRRLNFSKVCVEVGCSDDLPDIIPVNIEEIGSVEVSVEYLWRPSVCSVCMQFEHSNLHCLKVKRVWVPKSRPSTEMNGNPGMSDGPVKVFDQGDVPVMDKSKSHAAKSNVPIMAKGDIVAPNVALGAGGEGCFFAR